MEKKILYNFIEGTSSSDEAQQVRQWLETSEENRQTLLDERRFIDMTTLHTVPAPEKQLSRLQLTMRELLKVAAVALLVLAGSYFYFHNKYADGDSDNTVQTISVPTGQRVNLILPDGSHVCLNARSTLTYPVVFGKKTREMTLEGEAYFDVKPDAARPFIVHSNKGEVTALGTSFNVQDYAVDSMFEATLMKGKVKVKSNVDPSDVVELAPDNKVVLTTGKLLVEHVDDYTRYRWIEGLICFKNETFLTIMNELAKCYGVNIEVTNKPIGNYVFTGKFRYTDGVDYALRVLQRDIHFKYERDDERQIIYIK